MSEKILKKDRTVKRTDQKQAFASALRIRSSPRKMGLVTALIRNMNVNEAVVQLQFCKKRIALAVLHCLKSAIANAENNHNLDIDKLYVREAIVGKSFVMKRIVPRARGRASSIIKPFSNLKITLCERES